MRNPITFRVESSLGAVFICMLSLFFMGLIFVAIMNFNSDIDIMNGTIANSRINTVSKAEILDIQTWVKANNVEIPKGSGYRYLISKYPDRPWLD